MTKRKYPTRPRGRKAAPLNAKRPGRTAPGPLTPTGGNHREATTEAARIERRRQAWDLYVYNRWSMQQIATYLSEHGLPCTVGTVSGDIHAMANESKIETQATMRNGLDMELKRLDQMDRQLLPLAHGNIDPDYVTETRTTGTGKQAKIKQVRVAVPVKSEPRTRIQMEAVEKLRRNSESRRKLLGIDRQPDEGFIAVEQVVSMMRGLISDVLAITESNMQLRKALHDAMRKRFNVLDGEVVDAT